jgi:pimeloyl-ACP methyl ester carboxylesterase
MKRRTFVAGIGAVTVGCTSVGSHQGAGSIRSESGARRATFVLVHGAWHGGWCWERVATLLRADGHSVYTPTLTGLCERAHLDSPSVDLTTHINDIVGEVTWKDLNGIVLCGHSYGGMVIAGAAEEISDRIASIVFLDAFLPDASHSLAELVGNPFPPDLERIPPPSAAEFEVNEADRAWVDSKLTPQPAGTLHEKIRMTGALSRVPRRTYIRATKFTNPLFDAAFESTARNTAWITLRVESGHDVMIDAPEELAQILVAAA